MAEAAEVGLGEKTANNLAVVCDSPVTDPGSAVKSMDGSAAFAGRNKMDKSGALKKAARYRSRSLSASSADSYSSASYTGLIFFVYETHNPRIKRMDLENEQF